MNILVPYLSRWNSINRSRYVQILSRLAQNGHNVYLAQPPVMDSPDSGFVESREAPQGTIRLIDVEMPSLFWNAALPLEKVVKKGAYCLKLNAAIGRMIRAYHIDAVLFYSMALYPLAGRDDVVSVYDLGDDHVDLLRHELGKFSARPVIRLAERLLEKTLSRCDCVFSVSHHLAQMYFPDSIHLPNGVDMDMIRPGSGKHLRPVVQGPVVGFVGSLEYFIDFQQILDAAWLRRDCTFVVAGGGRQYRRLQDEKQRLGLGNLILTGGLPHEEILKYVDSFDICLNPFHLSPLTHGACPIKLFEYMAFHKPVISSRIAEVQRIGDGFLYWADSASELVSRIDEIVGQPREAAGRAQQGFEVLQRHYTWPRIADRFAAVVQERVEEKRRC